MTHRITPKIIIFTFAFLLVSVAIFAGKRQIARSFSEFWGEQYGAQGGQYNAQNDTAVQQVSFVLAADPTKTGILRWNEIAINASGVDHTPVAPGENRVFGEQLGPCRAARAEAIVHIAMFDVVNAIVGGYRSYTGITSSASGVSRNAAIAQAAHDTLSALFPSQKASFDQLLTEDLNQIDDGPGKSSGILLGKKEAKAILALRANDGSQYVEPHVGEGFIPSDDAGKWRQDPISQLPVALGAFWGGVTPFVIQSGSQFRIPPQPEMTSPEYTAAYNEVKRLGGDGVNTPTERTADQTEAATFWAYDGTPSLCAPPRLYNQITVHIAKQMGTEDIQLARLLALVNTAMADAGIAVWESKFFYQCWRPVAAIRESDPGTGPTGTGDGNPDTIGDIHFMPLGAPASNLNGPNFTPPFPAYPSGHAGFGGALFQTLRKFYGTDNIAFTFVSDELNGITKDNQGNIRPLRPRSFTTLSQAEDENGQSRIYLGIHFSFDKTQGITQGRQIADYIFKRAFVPVASKTSGTKTK